MQRCDQHSQQMDRIGILREFTASHGAVDYWLQLLEARLPERMLGVLRLLVT